MSVQHVHTMHALTVALCSEKKGPIVRDHFKFLISDVSHPRDGGGWYDALWIDLLRKKYMKKERWRLINIRRTCTGSKYTVDTVCRACTGRTREERRETHLFIVEVSQVISVQFDPAPLIDQWPTESKHRPDTVSLSWNQFTHTTLFYSPTAAPPTGGMREVLSAKNCRLQTLLDTLLGLGKGLASLLRNLQK